MAENTLEELPYVGPATSANVLGEVTAKLIKSLYLTTISQNLFRVKIFCRYLVIIHLKQE